jgi:hypothetical protein
VQGPPTDKGPSAAAAATRALLAAPAVQATATPSGAHDARDSGSEVSAEDDAAVTAVGTDFASVYDDGDGARSRSPPARHAPSPLDEEGDSSPAVGAAHDSDDEYADDNVPSYGRTYGALGQRRGELSSPPSWLSSTRLPLEAPLTDPAPKRHRRRSGEHRSSRSRALAPGAQYVAVPAPPPEPPVAQPLAWGSAGAPDVEASDNKTRAVAAWVATNSPQALRPGARNPWARPLVEPPRRGAASAPTTPSAPSGEAGRMGGRSFGGHAYSVPQSPGGSPGVVLAMQQQHAQQQPDGNAPNPMEALSHLMAELAGVQRALLAQQAVPSTPPSAAPSHQVDAPWATPGYRMRQPAWDADVGDGTPQPRVSSTSSATKPPLSGGRASRGHEHAPAVDATSPGLTRRSLLLQRVQQQAAGGGGGDDNGEEEEGSVQTSPEEWARSGGRAPSRSSGTFSFREDRPRAASPKMWQAEDGFTGESLRSGSLRAPANTGAAIARRGSGASATGSAPSEMGSEMDAFRAGGGLVPTSRQQRRQSTIPEEGARESEGDDDLMERIRADVIVPDDSSPQRHGTAEPTASPQRVATRRAALAERRVTAMELALEEAVAAAESAGWERDALVVRTAEAEAAATAAQEAVAHVQTALAAEQAQNEYLRRLLARAEELRDVARADAATLRERALAADLQLRQLLETLDARDAEALGVRARLRNDKARMVALQAERDQAMEHLRVSHDRGQLLHRVLGLALAACFVMALRLLLGTRPAGK